MNTEAPKEDPVALAAKLPLPDRTSHKNWKVRENAYRELTDKFNVAAEDAKIYSDFFSSLGKIVRDANAPAQLTGFDAVAKYADTAPPNLVKRVAADVSKGIVEKGLTRRPANKAKAIDAFLMFVGADAGEMAVDALVNTGFTHKTPKVVTASVEAATMAIGTYGTGAVPVKTITSKIGPLLGHSQESVRNAAKTLVILLHRWVGNPIKVVLKEAKEVTVKELEAAFAKHQNEGKPKPKKLTRSREQRARRTGGGGEESDEDDGFGEGGAEEEELDLAEEINLIEKLALVKIEIEEGVKKDWYTAIDSKKWSARKSALDSAIDIIGDARLTLVSYQDIFSRLRKIFGKDSNVNVVASAAKLVRSMANGLKKSFPSGPAKGIAVDLLFKLKEKNRIVADAVSDALDALHQKKCIRVVEMLDEISTAAKHKVPKARAETLLWLSRCLGHAIPGADLKGAPLKCFGNLLLKATDDSAPDVRDAALRGFAALQKLIGERNIASFVEKLDNKRKEKITALVTQLPEPVKATSGKPKAGPSKSGPSSNTRSKVTKRREASLSTASKPMASPRKSPTSGKSAKQSKAKPSLKLESDDEGETQHSPSDALSAAVQRFEGFEAENWSVKSFKTRAAAVGIITSALSGKDSFSAEDMSIVLGLLQCEPGLSDSNFIAVKPKLELFCMVATKCSVPPPRKTLKPLLTAAMEKLGDIKSSKMTAGILMSFAEATSPRYFLSIINQAAQETRNSRALIGMLKFATALVDDFGVPPVPDMSIASLASQALGNPAPAAKSAAATLACKAGSHVGSDKFRSLLEQVGATQEVLEVFDTEMPKYTRPPEPPTRKKRFEVSDPVDQDDLIEEADGNPEEAEAKTPVGVKESEPPRRVVAKRVSPVKVATTSSPQPRTPSGPQQRVSIAGEVPPGSRIFLDLKNSNWKKRQDALESVMEIVEGAQDCIKPNVGHDLIGALRARLGDTNRNLAALAYSVVSRMMTAMGPGGVIHLKILAPVVLGQGCVDIKKSVRESASKCLTGWFETYGLSPLIPYAHLPLISLNTSVRKEYLEWIVPRLQGAIGDFDSVQEDLSTLVDPCLVCLRDRTAEVRHFSDLALEQVVRSVGIAVIDGKVASLTKSARLQLEPVLDKYRATSAGFALENAQTPKPSTNATPRSARERPKSVALPRTPLHRRGLVGEDSRTPRRGGRRQRPASARVTPVAASLSSFATPDQNLENSPILHQNDGREARAQKFMARRLQFAEELSETDPSGQIPPLVGEEVEDLSSDLHECCSTLLYTKLTAPANRFRMHVEAIELIASQLEENPDALVSVADVLLRWAACRIEDSKTPPTVLVKLASFVSHMCEVLMSSGVKLGEYEASAALPPIVEKCGSNRDSVREAARSALLSVGDIVEDEVLLVIFTSCLRQPVSARAHTEISTEICRLIDKRCQSGAGIPPGVLPTIGRVAGGEDESAGRAAASCLERAHDHFGDDLWNLVGELSNEEAALLDDRLTSVINGMKDDLPSAVGDKEIETLPPETLLPTEELREPVASPSAAYLPQDIRNEDFRLSVAPAPPSSVLTSISDSLNMATPSKTRTEIQQAPLAATPGLPSRRRALFEEFEDDDEDVAADVLTRLQSSERDVQLSGLASIFDDLKKGASFLRSSKGPDILLRLVRCFGDTLERLESGSALDDDPAVLKSFLKGVIRFAREPKLLKHLNQSSAELLLSDALNAMIPQTVDGVEDWDQVRRGVNLMIVKVLESCDQNLLFTALINLLLANIRTMQRSESDKVSALAKSSICIKSIAKVAKRGFADCRVSALLRDIHLFLMANPVRRDGVSSSEDQTFAMRLLKTVVNAIIDEIGVEIRSKLDLVPQPEKSQLVHYVDMTLKEKQYEARSTDGDELVKQLSPGQHAENEKQSEGNMMVQEALSRIDPRQPSADGLRNLQAILSCFKEVDLEAHLEKFSPVARELVLNGIKRLSVDRDSDAENLETPGVSGMRVPEADGHTWNAHDGTVEHDDEAGDGDGAGQVYLKRLHEIQLRYGLQSGTRSVVGGEKVAHITKKESGTVEKLPSAEETRDKASSLRERMARIRGLQSASNE